MTDTQERKRGTISRLVSDRAYGFIRCPADERDYFFHQAELENCTFPQLGEGDVVTFTVGIGGRSGKPQAETIQLEEKKAVDPGPRQVPGRAYGEKRRKRTDDRHYRG